MTSKTLYTAIPFHHVDDSFLHKYSRRCVRPRYDKPGEKYPVAPISSIPAVYQELAPVLPVHKRIVSSLSRSYRAPNLSEYDWSYAESYLSPSWTQPGILVQIFSIITSINIKTIYLLERTNHPFRKWKRIILSYHLSEPRLYHPHVVDELDIE